MICPRACWRGAITSWHAIFHARVTGDCGDTRPDRYWRREFPAKFWVNSNTYAPIFLLHWPA
jgi:hypothetical protein